MTAYKPYEIIKDATNVINKLKYKAQYSKKQKEDYKDINTLIKALKCLDSVLISKNKTDAIDTLIYSLFYELLMFYKAYESELPIHQIINTIKTDLQYGSKLKRNQVVDILKTHELNNITRKSCEGELMEGTLKVNNEEQYFKDLKNVRTDEQWNKLINKVVIDLKTELLWKNV